jgi:hypothetical protein
MRPKCPFCLQLFSPTLNNPKQKVCSHPDCQYRRRQESRQAQRDRDPIYIQTCQDAQAAWREAHGAEYMRSYREQHPQYTDQNRQAQESRDQKRKKLRHFVKNNVALPQNPLSSKVFLVTTPENQNIDDLVKNNVALPQNPLPSKVFLVTTPENQSIDDLVKNNVVVFTNTLIFQQIP